MRECFDVVNWYYVVRDNMPVADGYRMIVHSDYSMPACCSAIEKSINTVKSILHKLCVEIEKDINGETKD